MCQPLFKALWKRETQMLSPPSQSSSIYGAVITPSESENCRYHLSQTHTRMSGSSEKRLALR